MTQAEIIQIIIGVVSIIVTVFVSFFIYWHQTRYNNHDAKEHEISEEEIERIIDLTLKSSVNPLIFDDCKVAIMENSDVGWYYKETDISKMRVALTNVLSDFFNNDRFVAKRYAIQLTDRIVNEIKKSIIKS